MEQEVEPDHPEEAEVPAGLPMLLLGLVVVCALPEIWVHLQPNTTFMRGRMYQYLAFWPGLFHGWRENYPLQRGVMFLTYGFVHAGWLHLIFNMITLVSLGRVLLSWLGDLRFALLYLAGLLGGGLGYGLFASRPLPMVGASGALFGLAGALLWVRLRENLADLPLGLALRDLTRPLLMLVGLNVVMYWAMGGRLAWETHLGGFLAGAAIMAVFLPRGRVPV